MRTYRWMALFLTCAVLYLGQAPLSAERAPEWLVGRYKGHNRKYEVDVELTIRRNGKVSSVGHFRDGRRSTDSGAYHDGMITLGSGTFYVTRVDRGIQLEQNSDQTNVAIYRLMNRDPNFHDDDDRDRGPDSDNIVPGWLIGRFEGHNRKYRVDTELTIRADGSVNSIAHFRDGRRSTDSGVYRDGKIKVGSGAYYADRTRNGFRLTQVTDANNIAEYHRVD